MKHNILLIFTIFTLIIASTSFALDLTINGETIKYGGPDVNLVLNGQKFIPSEGQMPPVIVDSRTLVPVREVFEKLGGTVSWDDVSRTVTIKKDDTEVKLTIDSMSALVNGVEKLLDVPAKIINNKTMVPVRFISENCGLGVDWNGETNTVSIKLPGVEEVKDAINEAYEKANEFIDNNSDKIQDVVDKANELIDNNADKIQEVIDKANEYIENNPEKVQEVVDKVNEIEEKIVNLAAKSFNEKFSRYFGDKKSKTVAYQLTDLATSNNAADPENPITVTLIDENGKETSANTIAGIHDLTSNILKYDKAFYEISGENKENGYLNKIIIKRIPW